MPHHTPRLAAAHRGLQLDQGQRPVTDGDGTAADLERGRPCRRYAGADLRVKGWPSSTPRISDAIDGKYAVSAIRGALLRHGVRLTDDRQGGGKHRRNSGRALSIDEKDLLVRPSALGRRGSWRRRRCRSTVECA